MLPATTVGGSITSRSRISGLRGFGFRLVPAGQPPLRFRVQALTTTLEETTMTFTRRHALSASVGAMASGSIAQTWTQTGVGTRPKLKLGIIPDLAGPYADLNRPSMACAQQALEDFDVAGRGWDVEILLGQHFDKADNAVTIALPSREAQRAAGAPLTGIEGGAAEMYVAVANAQLEQHDPTAVGQSRPLL